MVPSSHTFWYMFLLVIIFIACFKLCQKVYSVLLNTIIERKNNMSSFTYPKKHFILFLFVLLLIAWKCFKTIPSCSIRDATIECLFNIFSPPFFFFLNFSETRWRGCGNPESGGRFLPASKLFCQGGVLSNKTRACVSFWSCSPSLQLPFLHFDGQNPRRVPKIIFVVVTNFVVFEVFVQIKMQLWMGWEFDFEIYQGATVCIYLPQ